jgi:hypothetical protein
MFTEMPYFALKALATLVATAVGIEVYQVREPSFCAVAVTPPESLALAGALLPLAAEVEPLLMQADRARRLARAAATEAMLRRLA